MEAGVGDKGVVDTVHVLQMVPEVRHRHTAVTAEDIAVRAEELQGLPVLHAEGGSADFLVRPIAEQGGRELDVECVPAGPWVELDAAPVTRNNGSPFLLALFTHLRVAGVDHVH